MGAAHFDRGYSMVIDNSGNVITAGSFYFTVDFNPGAGTFNLSSGGDEDGFVQKLDSMGNFVWAIQLGGTSDNDMANEVVTDAAGNVYVTGSFESTVDFDPGPGVYNLTTNAEPEIFVVKYSSNGNLLWARSMGSTNYDYGWSLAVDLAGNVYTTGIFTSTADFDPGPGVFNMTAVANHDIFISKLDMNGNFVWAKQMASPGAEWGFKILLDNAGNIYTTGSFESTCDFDPGPGTYNLLSGGGQDIFVSKLDNNGNFIWAKNMGAVGLGTNLGHNMAIDNSGNLYITGEFNETVDFDPGPAIYNVTAVGAGSATDCYVLKLDPSGNFVWVKIIKGSIYEYGYSINLDQVGNIYTSGFFDGNVDFDPGPATFNITAQGTDIFICKWDSSGNFLWAKKQGGIGSDFGYAMNVDLSGNIYTTGGFETTADFDPNAGVANLTSSGGYDIFVSKLCQTPSILTSIIGADTICPGSTNIYSLPAVLNANSYTWTLPPGWTGSSTTNTIAATANSSGGTIIVTANNICGPSSSTSINIVVNSIPSAPDSIYGGDTICHGSSEIYNIPLVSGATSYIWTIPSGWNGSSTSNSINIISDSLSGTITVAAANSCGISDSITLYVSVLPMLVSPDSIIGPDTICFGTSAIYTAIPIPGISSYQWYLPAGWLGTSITDSIYVNANGLGGTIGVAGLDSCGAGIILYRTIVVNPLPNVNISALNDICINHSPIILNQGSPIGGFYSGIGVNAGQFDPLVSDTGTFTITYTYIDGYGCSDSATGIINVLPCLGIEYSSKLPFIIYPNPTAGMVIIKSQTNEENMTVIIMDVEGKILNTYNNISADTYIDINHLTSGIYFVKIATLSENSVSKIVKL
jgi:hypothetical protein